MRCPMPHLPDCSKIAVYLSFRGYFPSTLDINTTVSTCNETAENIITLVHAVWELVRVGTCCSGIDRKYDVVPLPSLISATWQNTLNWKLSVHNLITCGFQNFQSSLIIFAFYQNIICIISGYSENRDLMICQNYSNFR